MKDFFEFTKRTEEASKKALTLAEKKFSEIDEITEYNQRKVLAAFINNRIDETDFNSTTGYGYNDKGREKLDKLTAEIFGAEDGLIRATTLTCGTHTIATALYGVLRPGDIMLSVTGVPYDTIHSVIGIDKSSKGHGSLADFGVKFEYIELTENDEIDYDAIEKRVGRGDIKMVYIQRSRGYSLRHSISIDENFFSARVSAFFDASSVLFVNSKKSFISSLSYYVFFFAKAAFFIQLCIVRLTH